MKKLRENWKIFLIKKKSKGTEETDEILITKNEFFRLLVRN